MEHVIDFYLPLIAMFLIAAIPYFCGLFPQSLFEEKENKEKALREQYNLNNHKNNERKKQVDKLAEEARRSFLNKRKASLEALAFTTYDLLDIACETVKISTLPRNVKANLDTLRNEEEIITALTDISKSFSSDYRNSLENRARIKYDGINYGDKIVESKFIENIDKCIGYGVNALAVRLDINLEVNDSIKSHYEINKTKKWKD
jgi:hypothetical protein